MTAGTEFDTRPLTWIKGEIDRSLALADQALDDYTRTASTGTGDLDQIGVCRKHLHQVQGALSIIGLDGAKQLVEALERLLESVEKMLSPAGETTIALAHRCLHGTADYLDDLLAGHPRRELRLFPLYEELQKVRGIERTSPTEFFFPDLNVAPPAPVENAEPPSPEEFGRQLRQARGHYQKGLLAWLRNGQQENDANDMLSAVRQIEALANATPARTFWWVSSAFFTALAEATLPPDAEIKPLLSRIDQQIRQQLEGATQVANDLLRDILYLIAQSSSTHPSVDAVQQAYGLKDLLAVTEMRPADPSDHLQSRLRESLTCAGNAWAAYCAGNTPAFSDFCRQITDAAAIIEQLRHTDYRRLAQAIVAAANWLGEDSARQSALLANEIATGIGLAAQAQDEFPQLGSDFAQQVDVTVARLHRCIAGMSLPDETPLPALDSVSKQARQQLLAARVAAEVRHPLAQIEQVLDAFFRNPDKREDIATLEAPLQRIGDALAPLDSPGVVANVRACAEAIQRFSAQDYVPAEVDFEHVANHLARIGFFVDTLQPGRIQSDTGKESASPSAAPETMPPEAGTRDEPPPALDSNIFLLPAATETPIDTELLDIFLDEAREILATIDENIEALHSKPQSIEALTTLRRAFHTLKGSSRMVGLKAFGEGAWAIEQAITLWLQKTHEASRPLLDLITQARQLFSDIVTHLETGENSAPDPAPLIAQAESLQTPGNEQSPGLGSQTASAEIISLGRPPRPAMPELAKDAAPEARIFSFSPHEEPRAEKIAPTSRTILSGALLEIFRDEANGHLSTLRQEFPVLESEEIKPTPHEMYRAAHTLAGISATVGFRQLNQLGHALEYALLRRDQSAQAGSLEALGVIRQTIDVIELLLSGLSKQQEVTVPPDLIGNLEALYPLLQSPADTTGTGDLSSPAGDDCDSPAEDSPEDMAPPSPLTATRPTLHDEIDPQLLPIFLEEAQDLTQSIAALLRAWRNSPNDAPTQASLARLLHTLKGSARMAGAMNLGEITHAIESRVADAACSEKVTLDCIDEINSVFDDVQQIIERLQRGESLEPTDTDAAGEEETGGTPETQAAEETEAASGEDDCAPRPACPLGPSSRPATLRVQADLIDRLANEAGELSIARARIEGEMRGLKDSLADLTDNVIRLRRQLRDIEIQAETQMQSQQTLTDRQHPDFDPLEFDRFTHFQELTRMMAESVNDVATVQQSLLRNLDEANAAIAAQARLNRSLQTELMAVRMLPFGSLADRLYRIVRQTSKELNKRVNLEISGGQVELDRSVLDKISAPLEHLLRNAIAHGLETREARQAAGKPECGEITLSLTQEGNEVILTLADDGNGLDYPRIRARAIAAGLLDEREEVSEERLADMIFMPGFSTAAEISQIAGRGIGMDVVSNEVSHLGGRIEIASTPGQGTRFRLFIPLTLALTKALLVRVGSHRYAVPGTMIEQVLDLKANALAEIRNGGQADWQGHAYPFHFLPNLLGDFAAQPEPRRRYWVLLLRSGKRRIAVQVDELMGNREIVIKNIGIQLARVAGIDGATILGGGEIVLIINPIALAARAPATGTATVASDAAAPALQPTVMVVDDSLTVRKVLDRMLAREGYQVLVAKDGIEALEQLTEMVPDVMLIDIEMPRLDGFDLTRNIRADQRLNAVPIIMISSRTAEKHRQYAADIGVNHFVGKPFQEEAVLELVASLLKPAPPA